MRLVSHRFQSVILRIVRCRLLLAASLEDRKLILECYHPSAQYSEPYLYCDYLGTPGLGDCVADRGSLSEEIEVGGDGQMLQKLYSRFRPTRRDPQFKGRQPHPAGDVPGSRTSDAAEEFERKQTTDEPIKRVVSLDAHENFSQLVLNTDLVQLGPRRGVFLDILRVTEKKTLRIFREWMAQRIRKSSKTAQTGAENGRRGTSEDFSCELEEPDRTLWIDEVNKSAGLKVGIEERRWRRTAPLLMRRDEEEAVSYSIEIQGEPTYRDLAPAETLLTPYRVANQYGSPPSGHRTKPSGERAGSWPRNGFHIVQVVLIMGKCMAPITWKEYTQ